MSKVLRPMTRDLVTPDLPVVHDDKPRTGKIVLQAHRTALEPCRRRDDLESGTRLVRVIDAAVAPHPVQQILCALRLPLSIRRAVRLHLKFIDQRIRIVQMKLRHIHHREDLAIVYIHDNDRHARRLLRLVCLLCKLCRIPLYIHIDADIEVFSRLRLLPALPHAVELDPLGICQRQDLSLLAGQILLVGNLQTYDPLIVPSGES